MSSIVTAVFKVTIGLLVNKGRDKAAEKLKGGDVTDQKFHALIVREIDNIRSKLDGLSKKDLLASISFFKEGIELMFEVFYKATSRSEYGAVTTQAACAEAFSLAEGMTTLELTDLDESATKALSNAKKRFKKAREKATEAFNNEALETSDRILAMQYRVMATILEDVDNPVVSLRPCRVCIEELNSLSAVQSSFEVQLKKGIQAVRGLFSKDERRKVISSVCQVNRVIYDVTQTVGKDAHLWICPTVDIGEDKVDPLRDERVSEVLRKQTMGHCCVTPLSLGQEGEEEHKLKKPWGIATNSSGQFIVADRADCNIKVFDSTGMFISLFSIPYDDVHIKLDVLDVATDMKDNIYVLVRVEKPGPSRNKRVLERVVYEFNNTADLHHKFPARGGGWDRLTVTDSGKVLVLRFDVVDVYETDGQLVHSFGEGILKNAAANAASIAAADDGRVMVVDWDDSCVHIFSEDGDHLNKFKLQGRYYNPTIAFHRASERIVVAYKLIEEEKDLLQVEIHTKDGEFVRSTQIHKEWIGELRAMTVTTEGRIAVACFEGLQGQVLVI